jgi:hypothetical protein
MCLYCEMSLIPLGICPGVGLQHKVGLIVGLLSLVY